MRTVGAPPGSGEETAIDPYQVLGLARNASPEEIRGAYRRLARQHHPDLDPSPDANQRFRTINEAYRLLTSSQARSAGPASQPAPAPAPSHSTDRSQPTGPGAATVLIGVAAICLCGPVLVLAPFLAPIGLLALVVAVVVSVGRGRQPR